MKQIFQNLKNGQTELLDVPTPACPAGHLLIATQRSLISAGTERMLVEFGQGNLLSKARAQPERVRQVIDKARTDGIIPTMEAVFNKLDQPLPLGYCNAGIVLAVGAGVTGYAIGDRVVSNGPHAEIVCAPQNLCAHIPDRVDDESAAFTVLSAIALQGIRLINPTLGEYVVVSGLGLLGLVATQLLVANGCQVLGIDFNQQRLALARQFGAQTVDLSKGEDPMVAGLAFSQGKGVDAVLITASTKSDELIHQAAQMSRKRGRIVLVGVVGLNLLRSDFYEKELTFQVSCSYGPGRYDPNYEEVGQDYPLGFVRWTEQRNFTAILDLMASNKLVVAPLISQRIPQTEASTAYRLLTESKESLGILLTYPELGKVNQSRIIPAVLTPTRQDSRPVTVGVIGAGNFTTGVLLPALRKTPAQLKVIASSGGASAALAARRFGFASSTSDYQALLGDPAINTVLITTPHNSHARFVVEALQAGKHVFVEKPLALNCAELTNIEDAVMKSNQQQLLVGFNRRFSPLTVKLKTLVAARTQPLSMIYTVNAGAIPPDHWVHKPEVGGGRIIGEGCHFIDLLHFLADAAIVGVEARVLQESGQGDKLQDNMTILLDFADGSTGVVHYLANGSRKFPKERLEVFSQGRVLVLDNFRKLVGYDWPAFRGMQLFRQDKGHNAELTAFIERIKTGGAPLIPWSSLREVTLATFAAVERAAAPPRGFEATIACLNR